MLCLYAKAVENSGYAWTQRTWIKRSNNVTTLEGVSHKLANVKYFTKMDAKNGYWSVKLDADSNPQTTFNSSFSWYCFQRQSFGLVMSQDVFQQKKGHNPQAMSKDNQTHRWCSGLWTDQRGVWWKPLLPHWKLPDAKVFCVKDQKEIHFFWAVFSVKWASPRSPLGGWDKIATQS